MHVVANVPVLHFISSAVVLAIAPRNLVAVKITNSPTFFAMVHLCLAGRDVCQGAWGRWGGGVGGGWGVGGQYSLEVVMAELSVVMLTPWILAC